MSQPYVVLKRRCAVEGPMDVSITCYCLTILLTHCRNLDSIVCMQDQMPDRQISPYKEKPTPLLHCDCDSQYIQIYRNMLSREGLHPMTYQYLSAEYGI